MLERTYTIPEAAVYLRVSEWWLKKQIRAGHIKCTHLGRKRHFTEAQLAKAAEVGVELPGHGTAARRNTKNTAAAKPAKKARPTPPPASGAEDLVFDRSRSRNFRANTT